MLKKKNFKKRIEARRGMYWYHDTIMGHGTNAPTWYQRPYMVPTPLHGTNAPSSYMMEGTLYCIIPEGSHRPQDDPSVLSRSECHCSAAFKK